MKNVKVTHYSTLPVVVNKEWRTMVCGFYITDDNGLEYFVPCALYDGIPTNFEALNTRPSIYPYHVTGIDKEGM